MWPVSHDPLLGLHAQKKTCRKIRGNPGFVSGFVAAPIFLFPVRFPVSSSATCCIASYLKLDLIT